LIALSQELWEVLSSSRQVFRRIYEQIGTWLQIDVMKVHLQFIHQYGKDFWFPEANWSEKEEQNYKFSPGFKSFCMPYQCLFRIKRLMGFIINPKVNSPNLDSLSPEQKLECEKGFQSFYHSGLKVHQQYSKRWFRSPLIFGALADPQHYQEFSAVCLLAYISLKSSELGWKTLFLCCLKPAVLSIYKEERTLRIRCLVAVVRRELLASLKEDGLGNFWNILDRNETILGLLALLKSPPSEAVAMVKQGNTALFRWIQMCILAAPHQNKTVEGSFNIVDQILAVHNNISPEKVESIHRFLTNQVNPKKRQYLNRSGKTRWRPTKKSLENLVQRIDESIPDKIAIQKAKDSLKRKELEESSQKSTETFKFSSREQRYLDVFEKQKKKAPRRKKIDFHSKAATLEVKKTHKEQKKKGKVSKLNNEEESLNQITENSASPAVEVINVDEEETKKKKRAKTSSQSEPSDLMKTSPMLEVVTMEETNSKETERKRKIAKIPKKKLQTNPKILAGKKSRKRKELDSEKQEESVTKISKIVSKT